MAFDIMIERMQSEMSGTNMRQFVYVLKSILDEMGRKNDKIQEGEQKKFEEKKQI